MSSFFNKHAIKSYGNFMGIFFSPLQIKTYNILYVEIDKVDYIAIVITLS